MQFTSTASWEKLAIELEMLATEDPSSLAQLMATLNSWLVPQDSLEAANRTLNFMTYELMAQAETLNEAERFALLNHYYFKLKGFQILELKASETLERHLLLKPVLEARAGAPMAIALIYLHLAAHLDLPAYMIQMRNHFLLKWVRGGHSSYIDLCNEGRLVCEEELMQLVTRAVDGPSGESLSLLPNRKTFLRYAEDLVRVYERLELHERLHSMYNVILKAEPQNSRILGRRALLRRQLGYDKDALADLKRYFAFVDRNQASPDMILALQELGGRSDILRSGAQELLH